MKLLRIPRVAGVSLLLVVLCAAAVYATLQRLVALPAPLAAFAPPGAMLAIESPDFASLLTSWTNSPEERRWLAGDNYAAFSRSRLFDRLGQAQDEFAATAGLAPDSKFLQQIAGKQSLLAWYDIGNLEFLYITRLPAGAAADMPLLKLRDKFEQRSVGPDVFFVRNQSDPARTVAFAVRGDYLLLATREDLIAEALERMQGPSERSLLHEAWYASSVAAAAGKAGDLRMTLNLKSIVPSPYFRSYWIQQNITELKQYSAAVCDLYREAGEVREERVLVPNEGDSGAASGNLAGVLGYLPVGGGVYRAGAGPSVAQVVEELEDKVLGRGASAGGNGGAPVAELGTPVVGDAADLERRIDEPVVVQATRNEELAGVREAISGGGPVAMMVFSTGRSAGAGVFAQIHSGVVVEGSGGWDVSAVEKGVSAAVRGGGWTAHTEGGVGWWTLDGANRLAMAVEGKVWVIATDEATLKEMLAAGRVGGSGERVATTVAGFDMTSERAPFVQLTTMLERPAAGDGGGNTPAFFSGNIGSLVDVFGDLGSETFTESSTADHLVRQTVVYQWRH
jgi:hypothetical protein